MSNEAITNHSVLNQFYTIDGMFYVSISFLEGLKADETEMVAVRLDDLLALRCALLGAQIMVKRLRKRVKKALKEHRTVII